MSDNRPIGVFDSGLGGLTVVNALKKSLPNENIIYFGDTARVPYGDKSKENIIRFGHENCEFLIDKGVKLIIVACNTVSAVATEILKEKFAPIPVIGVLKAGVSEAIKQDEIQNIVIIGTRGTINSDAYRKEIHKVRSDIIVESVACPLFVPIVEEGLTENNIADMAISLYLSSYLKNKPDEIVLGCTHYPLLIDKINDFFNSDVNIIDSATACAKYAENFLEKNSLSASIKQNGLCKYYVSDLPSNFAEQAKYFLGEDVIKVEKV